jgi:hypothetical protein
LNIFAIFSPINKYYRIHLPPNEERLSIFS